ncbi:hypothetical protein WI697_04650 [Tistrella mobilis]|uniref:hypothetical protein n=1 Tax=Tistrella mobilis TaxID=171437 RepID=UPI0031F65034
MTVVFPRCQDTLDASPEILAPASAVFSIAVDATGATQVRRSSERAGSSAFLVSCMLHLLNPVDVELPGPWFSSSMADRSFFIEQDDHHIQQKSEDPLTYSRPGFPGPQGIHKEQISLAR